MLRFLASLAFIALFSVAASASPATLTVTVGGQDKVYSIEELEALGLTNFQTTTTWTDGAQLFEGVLLSDIAKAYGIDKGTVTVTAINAYAADIDIGEVLSVPVMLATRMNGERMSVRDKGPFWVVYPRDTLPDYADERHNYKWVWQVSSLKFQ